MAPLHQEDAMRRSITLALLALIASGAYAGTKPDRASVPPAVQRTLDQQGGTVQSLKHQTKQGQDRYQAIIAWQDQRLKVVVDGSGRLLSKEPARRS
jgi:hypothetical protein